MGDLLFDVLLVLSAGFSAMCIRHAVLTVLETRRVRAERAREAGR